MPSLRKIEQFNSATTSINRYLERLEQYFVANSVPADSAESHKRRAILISVIGAKAYDVLSDLCSPTPPSEKTYAQLTTILKNHFAPKKLYQDQSADVPLLHVEGSGPSLFGRYWLSRRRLGWTKICNIRVSETDLPQGVASQLRTTIQNHPNIFKPGLGTVKGITAKLEMKPDAHPKFCKARPVPYALQEAVEAEYNRLEDRKVFQGLVERVEFSE
ncbi:unnamed protein product [Porites lobata]|uniref:Uncharacterized protein n=1 Tax=Porites lobata TaxID=104759 RepID=A0ABN8QLX0_9CNID|nr:unnamed protein product [Porites lobata]